MLEPLERRLALDDRSSPSGRPVLAGCSFYWARRALAIFVSPVARHGLDHVGLGRLAQ